MRVAGVKNLDCYLPKWTIILLRRPPAPYMGYMVVYRGMESQSNDNCYIFLRRRTALEEGGTRERPQLHTVLVPSGRQTMFELVVIVCVSAYGFPVKM